MHPSPVPARAFPSGKSKDIVRGIKRSNAYLHLMCVLTAPPICSHKISSFVKLGVAKAKLSAARVARNFFAAAL